MVMVDTVYWLPVGGPVAQAAWFGAKVSSLLAPCCIHLVN